MKMKTVSLLAGASVPLIVAGSASAAFAGLKAEKKFVDPAHIIADAANIPGVTSLLVVNVYAYFTPGDAAAAVIAVGGSAALGIPLQINTRGGIFFQHIFQTADGRSPQPGFFPIAPTLRYDSFITIGRKAADDPVFRRRPDTAHRPTHVDRHAAHRPRGQLVPRRLPSAGGRGRRT